MASDEDEEKNQTRIDEMDADDSGDEDYPVDPNGLFEEDESTNLLVAMRSLSVLPAESESETDRVLEQRENLFHCRGKIKDNLASLIIDNGSCTNVVSWYVIDKMKIPTTSHPKPYNLQWMNDCGAIKVMKQAKIPLKIGAYTGEVLCDITPMTACHVLLR